MVTDEPNSREDAHRVAVRRSVAHEAPLAAKAGRRIDLDIMLVERSSCLLDKASRHDHPSSEAVVENSEAVAYQQDGRGEKG
jgi:hypothetical protein